MLEGVDFTVSYSPVAGIRSLCIITEIASAEGLVLFVLDVSNARGSIPAKVGFWVGLRMFSYVRTPTKLTNEISKTQLLGKKRGGSRQKYPECGPFFVFGVF